MYAATEVPFALQDQSSTGVTSMRLFQSTYRYVANLFYRILDCDYHYKEKTQS